MKNDTLDNGTSLHARIYQALKRSRKWMSSEDLSIITHPYNRGYFRDEARDSVQRRISDIRRGRYGECLEIQVKREKRTTFYRIAK